MSTRAAVAAKSKELLNALQRFNTKCLGAPPFKSQRSCLLQGAPPHLQHALASQATASLSMGAAVGAWKLLCSGGRAGQGAWYLHRFDALHGVECAISQRLYVVVVKWEQTEAMQVAEGILAYAGDLVGIQKQQLQRAESFEYARGQILYFIAIQHAASKREKKTSWKRQSKWIKHKWKYGTSTNWYERDKLINEYSSRSSFA